MNIADHHHLRHHFFRLQYTELNELYFFMAIRSFALSLVSIFIPVYLYNLGFGFKNILIYYISLYVVELFFEYPVARMIKKWGPKHMMVISSPVLIFHLWQLFSLQYHLWSPWFLGVSGGICLAFFWQAYHYDFSRSKHKTKTTREVGRLQITLAILGSIGPFLGGVIAQRYGVNILLSVVMILIIIASYFLFKTSDKNFRKGKLDLKKIKINEIKYDLISYAGLGWESVSFGQVWPMFLGLVMVSYAKIGLITSLSVVITIMVTYWVSKKSDSGKRKNFIFFGSVANTIVGIFQVFVETITQAFAINIGRSLAQSLQISPFDAEYYLHADEESRSEYIYLMESVVDISRAIFYVILLMCAFYLPIKIVLIVGLVMGAIGSLLVPLIPPARCEMKLTNAKIKLMPKPVK